MGERTSYAPGTFSWAELATSDQDAATTATQPEPVLDATLAYAARGV